MIKYFFGSSSNNNSPTKKINEEQDILLSVFQDVRISTELNKDDNYFNCGIIHKCSAVAINKFDENYSDFINLFGNSSNDEQIFDKMSNILLLKLKKTLDNLEITNPNLIYKISNLKMEFISIDKNSIAINAYGTLLAKIKDKNE